MARKDLSRTVIEGGRRYSNTYFRRASHGDHRATTRAWIDRVSVDLDEAEESDPPPRQRVYKQFHDKLSAAERWLAAQVGRPWDKVYADLCAAFDTRTTAGRHIVYDHMLPSVRRRNEPQQFARSFDLEIDAHGILRKSRYHGMSYRKVYQRVRAWAAGRVAASTYRGWWWFRKEAISERCDRPHRCERKHYTVDDFHFHGVRFVGLGALTRGELGFLHALPLDLYSQIVIPSPL